MRAILLMQVDGLPNESEKDLAEGFNELLHELGRQIPVPCKVSMKVSVGNTLKEATITVTPTPKKQLPARKFSGPRTPSRPKPQRRLPVGQALIGGPRGDGQGAFLKRPRQ